MLMAQTRILNNFTTKIFGVFIVNSYLNTYLTCISFDLFFFMKAYQAI